MMTQTSAGTTREVNSALDHPLALGIEANGTAVCAVVADDAGDPVGFGRVGGATPITYPAEELGQRLESAVRTALGERDPARVAGAVLGIAGITGRPDLDRVWQRIGLRCPVRVVADPVAAFATGTCAGEGAVLIAGAGAIAAWIRDEAVLTRVDGHGWLVGDDGSGFWLGRQAVRAVLAELDGRGEPTVLRLAVLGTITGSDRLPETPAGQCDLLRAAVYNQPPIALARLAPLVPAAAEVGDRVAQRIVDRAVALLTDTLDALFDELPAPARASTGPVVLSGTLLRAPGTIAREVSRRTAERYGRTPVVARRGAGGAAWLALRTLAPHRSPTVHTRLTLAGEGD